VARGIAYFANGDYDRAIADYNAATNIDKAFVNLALQRGVRSGASDRFPSRRSTIRREHFRYRSQCK
jgi:tetratricopeptide (TPR) repeat protein